MHARFISLYNGDWWYNVLGRVQSTCQSVTTETDFFFRSDESKSLPPPLTSPSSAIQMRHEIITTIIITVTTQQHWFSAVFFLHLFIFSRSIFHRSVFLSFLQGLLFTQNLSASYWFSLCTRVHAVTTNSVYLLSFLKCNSIIYIICKILLVV